MTNTQDAKNEEVKQEAVETTEKDESTVIKDASSEVQEDAK
ncbi:MAG TPA: hypothetical protein VJ201_01855 [Candidatus Babeliales bacterium]|nr:hypothetical protein [Candidatus Babeliales bacterium]